MQTWLPLHLSARQEKFCVITCCRQAVGRRVPILMDGGIRRGTDVLKVKLDLLDWGQWRAVSRVPGNRELFMLLALLVFSLWVDSRLRQGCLRAGLVRVPGLHWGKGTGSAAVTAGFLVVAAGCCCHCCHLFGHRQAQQAHSLCAMLQPAGIPVPQLLLLLDG